VDSTAFLQTRFKVETLPEEPIAVLRAIGKNRGCIKSGGVIDLHKAVTYWSTSSGDIGTNHLRDTGRLVADATAFPEVCSNIAAQFILLLRWD